MKLWLMKMRTVSAIMRQFTNRLKYIYLTNISHKQHNIRIIIAMFYTFKVFFHANARYMLICSFKVGYLWSKLTLYSENTWKGCSATYVTFSLKELEESDIVWKLDKNF